MANEAVLNYLRSTNRPYSANDIVINLHKEYGKTAIQKALDALVLDKKVLEKIYGKQKVYVIKQEACADGLEDEIKEIDQKLKTLTGEVQDIESKVKSKENELKNIQASLTIEEVKKQIDDVTKKLDIAEKKLQSLKTNSVAPISPKKLEAITKKRHQVIKEYKSRKRICSDIIEAIMDGYPKAKKALFEEIGIETDEEVQFFISE